MSKKPYIVERAKKLAFKQARELAADAVKKDKHMTPTGETREQQAREDYGAYLQAEASGWEETCHFAAYYGGRLNDIADSQAAIESVARIDNWERWHYDFYTPLKDAFWEEWAEGHHLVDFWEKNVKSNAQK